MRMNLPLSLQHKHVAGAALHYQEQNVIKQHSEYS
jgi:hypothetical protein